MDHEDLVTTFGQSVGVEKAEALVSGALERLDIDRADSYSSHEVADICETIGRSRDGYVRVVANEVWIREQAQRRFDALLSEISDPVVTVSFDDTEPIVAATNPAFEETFGYGSEAVGRPLTDLIVPEDDPPESVDRWLRSDGASSTEVERYTAEGNRRTFLFRSVVVSGFDADVEGFGIYTDITERKRRERRLELQNEQLERFASVVSHDLRNPLAVARGNLGLAREAASDPDVEERIDRVEDAHQKMDTLIEDLLELARRGQTVDDPEPTSLRAVVREAWRTVDTADVAVSLWGPPNLAISSDRDRLRQLLENLFRNSVEHSSTSSRSQAHEDAGRASSSEPSVADAPEDADEQSSSSPASQAQQDAGRASASEPSVADAPEDAQRARAPEPTTTGTPEDIVEQRSAGPASRAPGAAGERRSSNGDAALASRDADDASWSWMDRSSDGAASDDRGTAPAPQRYDPDPLPRVAVLESGVDPSGWGPPSPPDSRVRLSVEWSAGVLAVEDDGPGIPPEERERVLEHGYTTSADGTGFGLAIVQAIAEAHSWSVTVTEGRTGGARFEFEGVDRVGSY